MDRRRVPSADLVEHRLQRVPLDELHDVKRMPLRVGILGMDRHHIGMREMREHPCRF